MNQEQPKYQPSDEVDFVIVGSGAAGGVIAKELSAAGFRIVVLEQGPYLKEQDFAHDELKNRYRNALTNNHKQHPNTFRAKESQKARVQQAVTYGRVVGGGTVHFTGNYWRFHKIDFIERSKLGAIAGTGFADWPITYQELEPYYTKVEWEVGVSGQAGANPFDPPRSRPYPVPPLPIKSSGVLLERAARKLGLHASPAPMAILSKPHNGRNACVHCGFCEYFGCEVGAKSSTLASVIRVAEKTGRCEIRPNCYVYRIETNANGRVIGAAYFDKKRTTRLQRAKAVVVCANGAETPRLLLLSASKQFPDGLANSSGLVGKYLMLNSGPSAMAVFEHPLNDYKGVAVSRILHDFYELDPQKLGFYGGGGLDARLDLTPISFAISGYDMGGLPPGTPRWGEEFKVALAHNYTRTLETLSHGTSLPVESNSFSLDPDLKESRGLPALRMTYKDHPDDLKLGAFLRDRILELLDATDAVQKWASSIEEQDFAYHLLGTCRMGNDPKSSVINADHRAHDMKNLQPGHFGPRAADGND